MNNWFTTKQIWVVAMHKAILMMLLAIMSSSAVAEWVEVGTTSNETVILYADQATIDKTGNRVKMWSLSDYKTVRGSRDMQFMSMMEQNEYDCKEEKSRTRFLSVHSENMGKGNILHNDNETSDWLPVLPNSAIESLWRFACRGSEVDAGIQGKLDFNNQVNK